MELLNKYKPLLVLDKKEDYYPGSAINYINMSYFKLNDGTEKHFNNKKDRFNFFKSLAENNEISQILIEKEYKNYKTIDKEINIEKKTISPPVYCHVLEKGNLKQLIYVYFYNFNGPKKVLNLFPVGDHLADIELIVIQLKNDRPDKVFLSQHISGEWKSFEDMYKIKDQIIVFSAVNSHAHYSQPGKYIRIFGFGNDNCSKGKKVDAKIEYLKKGDPLYDYKGYFGKKIRSFNSRFHWYKN